MDQDLPEQPPCLFGHRAADQAEADDAEGERGESAQAGLVAASPGAGAHVAVPMRKAARQRQRAGNGMLGHLVDAIVADDPDQQAELRRPPHRHCRSRCRSGRRRGSAPMRRGMRRPACGLCREARRMLCPKRVVGLQAAAVDDFAPASLEHFLLDGEVGQVWPIAMTVGRAAIPLIPCNYAQPAACQPPSTNSVWPVTKSEASLARNNAGPMRSAGSA